MARTNAEAHIYLDLHPCECGSADFSRQSSVIEVDGELASEYRGACAGCGRDRAVVFRLPEQVILPGAGEVVFGTGSASELLDAGEWMWVADAYARATPDGAPAGSPAGRRARQQVATAAAAMDEVLAFIPDGQDAVPFDSLRSTRGRAVYDAEPGRFYRDRLEVVRDTYREILAEIDARTA